MKQLFLSILILFFTMNELPKKYEIKTRKNKLDEIPFDKATKVPYRSNCHLIVIHKSKDDMKKRNFSNEEFKEEWVKYTNWLRKKHDDDSVTRYGENYFNERNPRRTYDWSFEKNEYA